MHWHSPELAPKLEKARWQCRRSYAVCYVYRTSQLLLLLLLLSAQCILVRWEQGYSQRRALWSVGNEALPRSKALWSAESEAKSYGKISNFPTFILYLDYELLLRSLRSLRSNKNSIKVGVFLSLGWVVYFSETSRLTLKPLSVEKQLNLMRDLKKKIIKIETWKSVGDKPTKPTTNGFVVLSYLKGVSERIGQLLKQQSLQVFY